jgi:sugar phosphate permease
MKKQIKVLDQLLWLIELQTQKVEFTRTLISKWSKMIYSERLLYTLEIQENALERLKIRYNKHAYKLELFKIKY